MNSKNIALAALISLAATGAFASEASDGPVAISTLSRAEVVAGVAQARAQGQQFFGGEGGQQATVAVSTRERAEVRAEARAVRSSTAHLYVGA